MTGQEDYKSYRLILLKTEAIALLKSLKDKVCALDFETTSLDPANGRVRLTNLMCDDLSEPVLLDHYFCGSFNELIEHYVGPTWIVFNAKFEQRWFDAASPNKVDVYDVDFMAKAKLGGHPSSLAKMAQRDIKRVMDKGQQLSDWSRPQLREEQYEYAADDALDTWLIYTYWRSELKRHPHSTAAVRQEYDPATYHILNEAVRPTIECEDTGMMLDEEYHMRNIAVWKKKQALCERYLRKWVPSSVLANLNSDVQMDKFLRTQLGPGLIAVWPTTEGRGQLKMDRKTLLPIVRKLSYPFSRWMTAFIRYRYYNKYLSTYGDTLVTKQQLEGRLSFRLNIAQAETKRYSSSSFNIQNIPRAPYVRNAFLPPEGYEYFSTADYSGIEIRVLGELSGDDKLLEDAIYGNMHASMAAIANKIDEDDFLTRYKAKVPGYSEMRSKAKAGTFRITYGAGAGAVADSLNSSIEFAEEFIRKWAQRYPKAYGYRQTMFDIMNQTGFLPMKDGSTVYVRKPDRTIPVAANYGIQGSAALVMLAAMYHVRERRNALTTPNLVRLCATVHDEIILAVKDERHLPVAKQILEEGMVRGWLDIFPDTDVTNLLESGNGKRWGDCK